MLNQHISVADLTNIAYKAGKEIMDVYNSVSYFSQVVYKSDTSPLTLADQKSNQVIVNSLKKLYPEIPLISEEEKEISYDIRKSWTSFWLIDPLDGTKEFINRNGEFTVNIALIKNHIPVLGVIYVPSSGAMYYSTENEGAFKSYKGKTEQIFTRKNASELVAAGSRSHSSPEETEMLKKYNIKEMMAIGSSLKFCLIAEGKADIYFRHNPTMEWDTAAGQAIVTASGGSVYDIHGKNFLYNKVSLKNGSFLCLGDPDRLMR